MHLLFLGSVGMPPRDDMSSGVPMSGPPMSGPPMPGMDPNGPPGMYIRPSMPHYGGEPMPGVPQSPHGGPHGPPPHSLPPGHPMMNGPPPPQLGVPQPGMPPHPAATGMPPGVSEWNLLDRLRVALNSCFFTSPFSLSTSTIAGSFFPDFSNMRMLWLLSNEHCESMIHEIFKSKERRAWCLLFRVALARVCSKNVAAASQ